MFWMMIHQDWSLLLSLLILLSRFIFVQGIEYYCIDNAIVTIEIGASSSAILITREDGQDRYKNNLKCKWSVRAPENHLLQFTVKSSHLQYAREYAICYGTDFIEIQDKAGNEVLHTWCGNRNPYSIISKSSSSLVRFESDDRITELGVTLEISTFDPNEDCPNGWSLGPSTPDACYLLNEHNQSWKEAQDYCSYVQSNLASIHSDEEMQFIINLVSDKLGKDGRVWIGLNDIKEEGIYKWLDGSTFNSVLSNWSYANGDSDIYDNCALLRVQPLLLIEEDCGRSEAQALTKYYFICQRLKVGETNVHIVPKGRIEKGEEGHLPPKKLIIIGVACLCFLIVGVCIAIYWFCLRKPNSNSNEPANGESQNMNSIVPPADSTIHGATPSAPPYTDTPPKYDDVVREQGTNDVKV